MASKLLMLLTVSLIGTSGACYATDSPPTPEAFAIGTTIVLAAGAASPRSVLGFNCYSFFWPLNMKDDGLTSPQAIRVCQIVAYFLTFGKAKFFQIDNAFSNTTVPTWTQVGVDIQTVGAADALATVKGIELVCETDKRLITSLDDVSTNRGGTLLGTASNANGAVPRITLTSSDDQCNATLPNILKPYGMKGDLVVYMGDDALLGVSDRQVELIPTGGAGLPGLWAIQMNADSVDGVMPAPFASCDGFAVVGGPRNSVQVGTTIIAASTNGNGRLATRPTTAALTR